MASISLKHINKTYSGGCVALSDFSLDVADGELLSLAGPSGCGKSAVLRIISGLDEPDSGEIFLDCSLALGMSVRDRDIVLITNEHPVNAKKTTVYDALAYGLKLRKTDPDVIASRVESSAEFLGISHLLNVKANELSLLDLRKTALCRAAVRRPKAVLIDNILEGLEGSERIALVTDIIRLKDLLGVPVVFATPDGADAMTLGERVAVMKEGRLRQCDTPQWIYDNPDDTFVATYLGSPQMNMIRARLVRRDGVMSLESASGTLPLTGTRAKRLWNVCEGDREVIVGIRAEDIHGEQLFLEASPETQIDAEVRVVERLGGENILYLRIAGKPEAVVAKVDARTAVGIGERVRLAVDINKVQLFDALTGKSLTSMPDLNMLPCRLEAREDGSLSVRLGEKELILPQSVTDRLIDRSVISDEIALAVPPDGFAFEPFSGSVEFGAEVEFTVEYPGFTAVYMHADDPSCRIVASAPRERNLSAGEKVSVSVSPEKQLLCRKNGERLIARRPVSDNTATALIKGTDRPVATVGKNKFKLVGSEWKEGVSTVRIPPKAVRLGKGENTVSARVLDRDFTGIYTLLYLKIDGFDPYFTAAIEGAAAVCIGDKIDISIAPEKLSPHAVTPLSEYIKETAKDSPAYISVIPEDV